METNHFSQALYPETEASALKSTNKFCEPLAIRCVLCPLWENMLHTSPEAKVDVTNSDGL